MDAACAPKKANDPAHHARVQRAASPHRTKLSKLIGHTTHMYLALFLTPWLMVFAPRC